MLTEAQIEELTGGHVEQNVGVDSDGNCVMCGEEWPCAVIQLATALRDAYSKESVDGAADRV